MSIGKVQIDIEEFLFETAEPCLDDKTGNAWLKSFRDTLQYKGRKANPLPFGIDCILEAEGFNAQQAVKRMSGVVKSELVKSGIENPTPAQIEKALTDKYGAEYITYKNAIRAKEQVLLRRERIKQRNIEESLGTTAGAPTREDGEFKSGSGYAVNLETTTPAKPSLAYSGKNGLVRLTDDEYALLLQELGNKRKADRLIDDLDYKLAEGATYRQPHLHVLTHWQSYREDKAAEAAEAAKSRAAANAEAFGNVDRRTPFQKNQDELHQLYVLTSEKLKELK
jgi:hypothetical protein